jgi:hypothetical protein
MLSKNMPIYSLGSVQDQVLHEVIMKQQFVEYKKFEAQMFITQMSSILPHSDKNGIKDISRSIAMQLHLTEYFINYDIDGAVAVLKAKEDNWKTMLKVVSDANKE